MEHTTSEYESVGQREENLALLPTDREVEALPLKGRRVTIGRAEGNDLVLDDAFVSSRHCQVEERRGVYCVQDLGSRNGTRLNGVAVERGLLRVGDRLRVGRAMLLCVGQSRRPSGWHGPGGLVGRSLAMRQVLTDLNRFAARESPVLIEGETGTGKELAAHALHQLSSRRQGPFVAVNGGALTPDLAMSELFGHERGAFTGAALQHRGAFEQAHGGTLFLDEVGELDGRVQAALLRTLETGRIRRVGSEREVKARVRVIAATNRDLTAEVKVGNFRLDLYHRLAVLQVVLPPLRHRIDDLPELAAALLERIGSAAVLTDDAMAMLLHHPWPGNVRELKNVLERACALSESGSITSQDIRIGASGRAVYPEELDALQIAVRRHGSIAAAARVLGVPRTTLRDQIHKLRASRLASVGREKTGQLSGS